MTVQVAQRHWLFSGHHVYTAAVPTALQWTGKDQEGHAQHPWLAANRTGSTGSKATQSKVTPHQTHPRLTVLDPPTVEGCAWKVCDEGVHAILHVQQLLVHASLLDVVKEGVGQALGRCPLGLDCRRQLAGIPGQHKGLSAQHLYTDKASAVSRRWAAAGSGSFRQDRSFSTQHLYTNCVQLLQAACWDVTVGDC